MTDPPSKPSGLVSHGRSGTTAGGLRRGRSTDDRGTLAALLGDCAKVPSAPSGAPHA